MSSLNGNIIRKIPSQIIAIRQGGLAIHGARLIGAVITGVVFAKRRGLSFWKFADIAAPSILLEASHWTMGKLYEPRSTWW